MGTQRSERFDEVEWDEISRSRWFEPSKNTLGVVFCTLPLALLGIYD